MAYTPGPCTRVFWDHMDFRLPSCTDDVLRLQKRFERIGFTGELSIMAYVENEYFSDVLVDEYKKRGITIIGRPTQGGKLARVQTMMVDIVLWALENPATYYEPLNLMVISENIKEETDFLNALEALGDRYYNVLVAMPQDHLLSSDQLHTVSFDWLSTSLLDQGLDHKWKSRKKTLGFSDGLASLCPQYYFTWSNITIFWDVRKRLTGDTKIGQALCEKGYNDEVFVRPYVDGDHQWRWVSDDVCHVHHETRVVTKEAKVTRMLLDLLFWAMNHDDTPQHFMLLTIPDTNCDRVIKALEHRGFYHILETSDEVSLPVLKSPPVAELLINQSVKLQGRKLREGLEFGDIVRGRTAVFWQLEGHYPSDPKLVMRSIKSTLEKKGYNRVISLTVYIDEGKFPIGLMDAYIKSGMIVRSIDEDYGLAKFDIMAWDMIMWRFTVEEPSNFVVIAKPFRDTMFDCVLDDFGNRGLNVLLELPDYMVTFGSTEWSAKRILGTTSYLQEDSPFEIMSYASEDSLVQSKLGPCIRVNTKFPPWPCLRVYWNVMDFPFPDGVNPDLIYGNMKRFLEKEDLFGELSIVAYVDEETFPNELLDVFEKAGIIIVYLPQGSKQHRCRLMFIDIAWWLNGNIENPARKSLMVISNLDGGKPRFIECLDDWATINYNVLLAMPQPPPVLSPSKLRTVTFTSLQASLVLNLKRNRDDSEQNESDTEQDESS